MKHLIPIFLCVFLCKTATAADLSTDFYTEYNQYNSPEQTLSSIERLKDYHFILVTGFFNEKQINGSYFIIPKMDIFLPQKDVLKAMGISFERFTYDEDRITTTARNLSLRIAKSEKPVILITHSQGSQIALEALLINGQFDDAKANPQQEKTTAAIMNLCKKAIGPELRWNATRKLNELIFRKSLHKCGPQFEQPTEVIRGKVAGWLSLNGNVLGSPLVDLLYRNYQLVPMDALLDKNLRREFLAMGIRHLTEIRPMNLTLNFFEMSESVATTRAAENVDKIVEILTQIPMLSVTATYKTRLDEKGEPISFTDRISVKLDRTGHSPSDGVVPTMNSVVPGSDFILLDDVSHFDMVKDFAAPMIDSRKATYVLLKMLSDKMQ